MMGNNGKPQDELFYAFNLDDVVPKDHLLRETASSISLSCASTWRRITATPGARRWIPSS
jgi:hypothetical protein